MAKICQLWFVSQLGIDEDETKPRAIINPQARNQQEDGPVPAQPRRRNEARPNVGGFAAENPGAADGGYGFAMLRKDVISLAFTSEDVAKAYAKQMAAKNPQTAYGVFGCTSVVETTVPTVVEKNFNSSGELVIIAEKADGQESGVV